VVGSPTVIDEDSDSLLPSVVPGEVVIVVGAEEAVIMVVTLVSPAEQEIATVATVRRRNGVWRVACMVAVREMVTRPSNFADGMRHIFRKRGRGKTLADA
jgi:predicted MarR family transcription regulator